MASITQGTTRDPAAGVIYEDIEVDVSPITRAPHPISTTNKNTGYVGTFAVLSHIERSNTQQNQRDPTVKPVFELVPESPQITNPAVVILNKIAVYFRS